MGKAQRTKGATFEREIANDLSDRWGRVVKRNIGQSRDGGDDITAAPFRIECKRRKGIAVYEWMDQVCRASDEDDIPVVIMRADSRKPLVLMTYEDWAKMAQGELLPHECERCGKRLLGDGIHTCTPKEIVRGE